MSLEVTAKESIDFAHKNLFFRFCGTIIFCFAIIMMGVGFIMVNQLDSEQKKILNSMASEYQRILSVHGAEKLRFIATNNPQQLIEHEMTLLQVVDIPALDWSAGSQLDVSHLDFEQSQWAERRWYHILTSTNYLSLLIFKQKQKFWLVVNLNRQLNALYQQWQWIAAALAILCFIISIVVWRLIRSTLFPLHRLALVVDHKGDWSIDSLNKINQQQLTTPKKGLDVLHTSTNLLLGRLVSTIESMEMTVDAIAHDLRTPLSRIGLTAEKYLSKVKGGNDPQELQFALSDCAESAHQADHMLTTLMGIHEEIAGTHAIQVEKLNLAEFILNICTWYREIAEESDIEIDTTALNSCEVKTDFNRLNQVLVNLIDNAIKFSTEGDKVRLRAGYLNNSSVYFEVIDDGVGIDPKHHELIFKRLFRVDSSRSSMGYGLGLAQVKTITETLHGRIEVDSVLGEGCCIRIVLPRII